MQLRWQERQNRHLDCVPRSQQAASWDTETCLGTFETKRPSMWRTTMVFLVILRSRDPALRRDQYIASIRALFGKLGAGRHAGGKNPWVLMGAPKCIKERQPTFRIVQKAVSCWVAVDDAQLAARHIVLADRPERADCRQQCLLTSLDCHCLQHACMPACQSNQVPGVEGQNGKEEETNSRPSQRLNGVCPSLIPLHLLLAGSIASRWPT